MFRTAINKEIGQFLKRSSLVAHCEEDLDEANPLLQQADAMRESKRPMFKSPGSFDGVKNSFHQSSVGTYDGFRFILQRQLNLNTVVSHFYWIGSTAVPQPVYQYRVVLPLEDNKMINVSTDATLSSVDGEVRLPVSSDIYGRAVASKFNFNLSEQPALSGELEANDESSCAMLHGSSAEGGVYTASYMQAVTPGLALGGSGSYCPSNPHLGVTTSLAGVLSKDDHSLTAMWDNNLRLMYTRKVNPNRVHLTTDLTVDEHGNSNMSLSAEYILKQAKLTMSVDSSLHVKSLLETDLPQGMHLQLAAEVDQLKNSYKIGCGIIMG